jgi:hypothetical protein
LHHKPAAQISRSQVEPGNERARDSTSSGTRYEVAHHYCFQFMFTLNSYIFLFLMINVTNRQREADEKSLAVNDGIFSPSVDIFEIFLATYSDFRC